MADPFKLLEADHRMVEKLLAELEESEAGAEREQLAGKLIEALAVHMEFEERQIYPLTRELLGAEDADEAEIEHQLTRGGLDKLSTLVAQPGFGAVVAMLQAGIGHHVDEEEGEMFPAMRQRVDEAQQEQLARRLLVTKRDAGLLTASLDEASKGDLEEMAEALGLEPKSSMTKDDLRALVESFS